jgi:Zn-dependent membrane protease YugP
MYNKGLLLKLKLATFKDMIYLLLLCLVLILAYGPSLWVRYILRKYSTPIADMPGTGAELATHLIERFELKEVRVKMGSAGENYYSPDEKIVCLSPDVFAGKSLTAVAVAAHEVGHAIQFNNDEAVTKLRQRYLGKAAIIKRAGSMILMSIPLLTIVLKSPVIMFLGVAAGLLTMLVSVLMYAAILPEEYDASYNKALPILAQGYLPEEHMFAAKRILKACALTYVAAALADILSLWRWFRMIR